MFNQARRQEEREDSLPDPDFLRGRKFEKLFKQIRLRKSNVSSISIRRPFHEFFFFIFALRRNTITRVTTLAQRRYCSNRRDDEPIGCCCCSQECGPLEETQSGHGEEREGMGFRGDTLRDRQQFRRSAQSAVQTGHETLGEFHVH